ncbi:MAG: hypothetical protein JXR13_00075 [Thalassovita sp.]
MKPVAAITLSLALLGSPALAGNPETPRMDPEVITGHTTSSANASAVAATLVIFAVILAALD